LEELLPKDNENIQLPFVGPVAPTEPAGFAPDQMIKCEECLRANPPTRVTCLYCACALPITEASARLRKPTLRRPERGQPGYNNIFLPQVQNFIADNVLKEAAEVLKLTPENLQGILSTQRAFPLALTASAADALLVLEKLRELGVETRTLTDDELGITESCVTRIRSMQFDEGGMGMIVQQSGAVNATHITWSDLVLLVTGRLLVKRLEVKERKSRNTENEILDTSEFFADEDLIDLYASSRPQTWRIAAHGFDFSCLGEQKTLVSTKNFAALIELIRARSRQAHLDDSYNALRQTLDLVWGGTQETESSGWRREWPGKYSLKAATVTSNETQFTRYSRLCYYLTLNSVSNPQ